MTKIEGVVGYRPSDSHVEEVTAPPYDVIKPGSRLETLLFARPNSISHVDLGADPVAKMEEMVRRERERERMQQPANPTSMFAMLELS